MATFFPIGIGSTASAQIFLMTDFQDFRGINNPGFIQWNTNQGNGSIEPPSGGFSVTTVYVGGSFTRTVSQADSRKILEAGEGDSLGITVEQASTFGFMIIGDDSDRRDNMTNKRSTSSSDSTLNSYCNITGGPYVPGTRQSTTEGGGA